MTHEPWVGKVIWVSRASWSGDDHYFCEAPRHLIGPSYRAIWVAAFKTPDGDYVQGMCQECMAYIAADLGTTPEESAVVL